MKCKYLNLYRLSKLDWSITSCTANDRPYSPSLSELHDYCKGKDYARCPVLLGKDCVIKPDLVSAGEA